MTSVYTENTDHNTVSAKRRDGQVWKNNSKEFNAPCPLLGNRGPTPEQGLWKGFISEQLVTGSLLMTFSQVQPKGVTCVCLPVGSPCAGEPYKSGE